MHADVTTCRKKGDDPFDDQKGQLTKQKQLTKKNFSGAKALPLAKRKKNVLIKRKVHLTMIKAYTLSLQPSDMVYNAFDNIHCSVLRHAIFFIFLRQFKYKICLTEKSMLVYKTCDKNFRSAS